MASVPADNKKAFSNLKTNFLFHEDLVKLLPQIIKNKGIINEIEGIRMEIKGPVFHDASGLPATGVCLPQTLSARANTLMKNMTHTSERWNRNDLRKSIKNLGMVIGRPKMLKVK